MHIAFAICFFLFVGLCETLRHGLFGLNGSEIDGIVYGTMGFLALFLLRGDVVTLLRSPRGALYGNADLNWNWGRSVLGLFLGPLLWVLPIAYGLVMLRLDLQAMQGAVLVPAVLASVFLTALAEQLFLRETVLKAFASDLTVIYVVSVLATFTFYLSGGVAMAMIGAGAGMFFLTLRLIGANSLAIAVIQAATVLMFSRVLSLGFTPGEMGAFAPVFFLAAAVLSLLIYGLFSPERKEVRYA